MGGSKELEEGKVVEGLATDGTGGDRLVVIKLKEVMLWKEEIRKCRALGCNRFGIIKQDITSVFSRRLFVD